MNTEKLDKAVLKLAEAKTTLSEMDYSDPKYDELEDRLHNLEDAFLENDAEMLEDIIADVHDELCPEEEVLSPISYIADSYLKLGENENGPVLDVNAEQGVMINLGEGKFKSQPRLVVVPNPLRVILNVDGSRFRVWPKSESN
jgi:hypothetical protein